MIENQIVRKSSNESTEKFNRTIGSQSSTSRIYFDTLQAVADFESESKQSLEAVVFDSRVGSYVKNAQVLMNHAEYVLALNLLRQAANIDSHNIVVLNLIAQCLEKRENFSEALLVRKVLVKIDYSFSSLYRYANNLYRLGRDQEAIDKYFEALAILKEENSDLFDVYKNMGNIFVKKGDFEAAEEYYHKAYTLSSNSDVLLVNLGTLEVQRNDFEKALYCFRRAIEINSRNDKAWVGLAMVHNQLGDSDLALANIESALDVNPQNRTAVHLAANWGVRENKIDKAIEYLQTYLSRVDEDEEMSLVLINLFCTKGQYSLAALEVERVLLWNPNHSEVRSLKLKIQSIKKAS